MTSQETIGVNRRQNERNAICKKFGVVRSDGDVAIRPINTSLLISEAVDDTLLLNRVFLSATNL